MKVSIDSPSVLAIAVTLFKSCLLDCGRTEAKRHFRDLDSAKILYLSEMAMSDKSQLKVKLELMSQEFRGQLNFSAFREHLLFLVAELVKVINAKSEPIVMSDNSGLQLMFNIPALSNIDGVMNALVLGANLGNEGELLLQLMFIDPDQFLQSSTESALV
ncbi:MAG: hypothetical protein ACI9BO_000054 [Zhongshania sp.]|jgi:hypothetical protein